MYRAIKTYIKNNLLFYPPPPILTIQKPFKEQMSVKANENVKMDTSFMDFIMQSGIADSGLGSNSINEMANQN